jgi:hypothetical protein
LVGGHAFGEGVEGGEVEGLWSSSRGGNGSYCRSTLTRYKYLIIRHDEGYGIYP